jgi:hypothetical protein
VGGLAEVCEKSSRLDLEGVGERHDVEQGDVSLPALDTPDVIAMEVREFGERLLGEAFSETQLAQVFSKGGSGVSNRHPVILSC